MLPKIYSGRTCSPALYSVGCSKENLFDDEMLYIGPWLEYKLARQLEESNSSRPEALRLPQNARRRTTKHQSRLSLDPISPPKKNALPSISFHRPTKCSTAKCENDCIPTVLPAYTHKRRDFCGETRSLRRFQAELASLGSPVRKATPVAGRSSSSNRGSSHSRRVSAGTNKRLAQIQRMQNIYRQGKGKAQTQFKNKPRQDKIILPSVYSNTKASQSMSFSRQVCASTSADDCSDDDDKLLSWVGGLDLGGI